MFRFHKRKAVKFAFLQIGNERWNRLKGRIGGFFCNVAPINAIEERMCFNCFNQLQTFVFIFIYQL